MRKILLWVANVAGWALDAKELYFLLGGTIALSGIIDGIISIASRFPVWLLIIILIGLIIVLFTTCSYIWDWIKRKKEPFDPINYEKLY